MTLQLVWDLLSWGCLLLGSAFAITGGIGLLRLPDFYARMHGGGITDTMGAGLILLGLGFQAGVSLVGAKLLLILVFLMITSPTTAHALAKAALADGVEPFVSDPGKAGVP
jgi:multicomponent Na+:H+ antiporter subunit G